MLNRYLGNKSSIIGPIKDIVTTNSETGDMICDPFSGSVVVSFELKKMGYKVACNDVNLFSHFYGKHLIEQCNIPDVNLEDFMKKSYANEYSKLADAKIVELKNINEGYVFLSKKQHSLRYRKLLAVIIYLNDVANETVPTEDADQYIFDTYTEEGKSSYFKSSRGTEGRRRFFKAKNGKRIDRVLSKVRAWKKEGLLDHGYLYYTIICTLLDAIEKVSNTQGTYHDFPRDKYDSRSSLDMKLLPPDFDGIITRKKSHLVGFCEDSLEFIKRVPEHSVLYLDPPYNFRQYTSYYFLPNIICEYCDIPDLNQYFSKIEFVRGQNMDNDFVSSFSKKREFIASLYKLVSRSKSKNVVMSYFDGRNHWNNTTNPSDKVGEEILTEFFNGELFSDEPMKCFPVDRLNYQSHGGHKARVVSEYLFLGERAK